MSSLTALTEIEWQTISSHDQVIFMQLNLNDQLFIVEIVVKVQSWHLHSRNSDLDSFTSWVDSDVCTCDCQVIRYSVWFHKMICRNVMHRITTDILSLLNSELNDQHRDISDTLWVCDDVEKLIFRWLVAKHVRLLWDKFSSKYEKSVISHMTVMSRKRYNLRNSQRRIQNHWLTCEQ